MFSQTAEYALRAVVVLAIEPEKCWTSQGIAAESKVPHDYLIKVLQALSRAGLVAAQRGRGGGFMLRLPSTEITVLGVINAVDPLRRITSCPLGLKAHGRTLCPLHRKLDDAIRSVEEAFASTSIAGLLNDPSPIQPLREGGPLCHVQIAQ